jgi:peptidoglycan/xylan/chitin deacetylase (PgdA/CDA1 family)
MSSTRDRLATTVRRGSKLLDRLAPATSGLTILIYHRVGRRTDVVVDLAENAFRAQIELLAATSRVTTLADGLNADPASAPIVITFDDGTADWGELAMPILVENRLPATFYVSTRFVEDRWPFPDSGAPISWAGLAEMAATGLATIGSHTHSHLVLDRAGAATATDEIDRSRALIEDRLGVVCADFAYPKAILGSPAAEIIVRRTFATAALAGSRTNGSGTDRHRLWRTPITVRDDADAFSRKINGGLRLEGHLRQARDRLRRLSQ